MRIPYFQIDAFASQVFGGNPAGVCLLEQWLPDAMLQSIAAENHLAETAFLVRGDGFYRLRWFAPRMEIDLCGHATLAAAHALFFEVGFREQSVKFQSRSGLLSVCRRGELLELDFPSRRPAPCAVPDGLVRGLGRAPREVLRARDYLAVFDSASEIMALRPEMDLLAQLDCLGTIVTAPGAEADFVSRFFAPRAGVPEDPVTGSAHCTLIPFWSARLGKKELFAKQLSSRGGELHCRDLGERVGIGGQAVTYSRAELEVPALE